MKLADELGPVLTGRARAETLRESIEIAVTDRVHLVIDFEGVKVMSPSFADELFAKLPRDIFATGHVSFENLSGDLTALMRFVVSGRHPDAEL